MRIAILLSIAMLGLQLVAFTEGEPLGAPAALEKLEEPAEPEELAPEDRASGKHYDAHSLSVLNPCLYLCNLLSYTFYFFTFYFYFLQNWDKLGN